MKEYNCYIYVKSGTEDILRIYIERIDENNDFNFNIIFNKLKNILKKYILYYYKICGIIGYLSNDNQNTINILYEGLRQLQNRGYDSAGICYIQNNDIKILNMHQIQILMHLIKKKILILN